MKAIETRYSGYNFRSRLEARWAVFFDSLGIEWEYEAQGYACGYRLTMEEGTFPYLPDFWLPELKVFAEVKGSLDETSLNKVLNAAAYLSNENRGGCATGQDGCFATVLLGPIPEPFGSPLLYPNVLHMHEGDLVASPWNWNRSFVCATGEAVARDSGETWGDRGNLIRFLLGGQPEPEREFAPRRKTGADLNWRELRRSAGWELDFDTTYAYEAARGARFEFGGFPGGKADRIVSPFISCWGGTVGCGCKFTDEHGEPNRHIGS